MIMQIEKLLKLLPVIFRYRIIGFSPLLKSSIRKRLCFHFFFLSHNQFIFSFSFFGIIRIFLLIPYGMVKWLPKWISSDSKKSLIISWSKMSEFSEDEVRKATEYWNKGLKYWGFRNTRPNWKYIKFISLQNKLIIL
jgi:hypothetical protein